MLEFMRKNAGSKLVWLIIGAISLVFVFFGVGGSQGGGRLITVNGQEISMRDYEEMTRTLSRNMGNAASGDPTGREKRLRGEAVATLVSRALAQQFGRNLGLTPTDRAVARYIYGIEAFQVDGKFNKEQYEYQLGRTSVPEFEKGARRDLTVSRANALVGSLSQVYQPEAMQIYHFRADRMSFDFVFFPSEKHREGLAATDGALGEFYAANQEKWRLPATLKVEYVEIKPADFLEEVQVSEEELKNAYAENADRFTRPETALASHILFKFPRLNPTDDERAAALERARQAFEGATADNFADRARELSDDPVSAARGGELGGINADTPLFNITEAVLALPLNTVSEPLESLVGYHLVMVTGREEARPQTLEEARGTLEGELKAYKARQMAVARLEDLILRTETNPNLADAAKSMGLESRVSEPFTADAPPEFFEGNPDAVQKAFQAEVGRVAAPVEELDTLALFTPLERVESLIPPLSDVKEAVTRAWIDDEAGKLARLEAAAFIRAAETDGWEGAAAPLAGVKSGRSELLPRFELVGSMPFLFADRLLVFAAVNSVTVPGQISPVPVPGGFEGEDGCFALKLAAFEPAPETGFEGLEGTNIMVSESMNRAAVMTRVWMDELVRAANDGIYIPEGFAN